MPRYKVTVSYITQDYPKEWLAAEHTCQLLRAVADFKIEEIEPVKSE